MMGRPMKTYRGFLLDADNTLFDYDRAEREAFLEAVAPALPGVPPEQAHATYCRINAEHWARFERQTHYRGGAESGQVPGSPGFLRLACGRRPAVRGVPGGFFR